jgi:hypothetical protein
MPARLQHRPQGNSTIAPSEGEGQTNRPSSPQVHLTHEDEDAIAEIHRTLTSSKAYDYSEPHSSFDKFLEAELQAGRKKPNLGVCFQSLSTWGAGGDHANVKTLGTALWRTLTFQDVYEWTIKPWISKPEPQSGRQLIRDFTGVVRGGEIML